MDIKEFFIEDSCTACGVCDEIIFEVSLLTSKAKTNKEKKRNENYSFKKQSKGNISANSIKYLNKHINLKEQLSNVL